MLSIDRDGLIAHPRIKHARSKAIERNVMHVIHGIIVHQTGGPTAQSTLNSYKKGGDGAHFLIDKNGVVYQTASLYKQTQHVGKLKARCVLEKRCAPARFDPKAESRRERQKKVPDRFPANQDSIGIEIVGEAFPRGESVSDDRKIYESVTHAQNASLVWLISKLTMMLKIPMHEIFRHPIVSWKNETEARTAKW